MKDRHYEAASMICQLCQHELLSINCELPHHFA